ncbi:hypothetical protein CsSME_00023032 [Camellia sinensis var. sinensis]
MDTCILKVHVWMSVRYISRGVRQVSVSDTDKTRTHHLFRSWVSRWRLVKILFLVDPSTIRVIQDRERGSIGFFPNPSTPTSLSSDTPHQSVVHSKLFA